MIARLKAWIRSGFRPHPVAGWEWFLMRLFFAVVIMLVLRDERGFRFDDQQQPNGIAHFVNRDYEAAIDDLSRMQNHSFYDQLYAAAANAYLCRKKHAAHNLAFVREKKPRLTIADAPYYLPYRAQEDLDHVVNGLKLAGLTA